MMRAFAYARPDTLAAAAQLAARRGACIHAGGTDLLGCLRDGVFAAETVVSISGLAELRGITPARDGGLRLGALVTVAELAADTTVRQHYAALAEAASQVASPQLRNQGTLGGNLCQKPRCWYYRGDFPCLRKGGELCYAVEGENHGHALFGGEMCFFVHPSDLAPALIALGASMRVNGPAGLRALPLDEFFVPPGVDPLRETVLEAGEILTEVILPPPVRGLRSSYRKVRARAVWDFALAGVALALRVDAGVVREARVVLSGVAPIPWRHRDVEAALVGRRLDGASISAAAAAATRGAGPMTRNAYKVELLRGLVTDELERLSRA